MYSGGSGFTMRRDKSKIQRTEVEGWQNRSNTTSYQYEEIDNEYGNTTVIIERINGLNKRISEAKQRSDRERKETDKRFREIAERSNRTKRDISEDSKELYRKLTEFKDTGISSLFFDRAKSGISKTIRKVSDLYKKAVKEFGSVREEVKSIKDGEIER